MLLGRAFYSCVWCESARDMDTLSSAWTGHFVLIISRIRSSSYSSKISDRNQVSLTLIAGRRNPSMPLTQIGVDIKLLLHGDFHSSSKPFILRFSNESASAIDIGCRIQYPKKDYWSERRVQK